MGEPVWESLIGRLSRGSARISRGCAGSSSTPRPTRRAGS
ncbi:hypothetical protein [Streptomyces decoyicus]